MRRWLWEGISEGREMMDSVFFLIRNRKRLTCIIQYKWRRSDINACIAQERNALKTQDFSIAMQLRVNSGNASHD